MSFFSNKSLTLHSEVLCSSASSRCCSSTICVFCSRAVSIDSLTALAASLFNSGLLSSGVSSFLPLMVSSTSFLRLPMFMPRSSNNVLTSSEFSLNMPSRRCSGPTSVLQRRCASSRLKARISESLLENWLIIIFLYL